MGKKNCFACGRKIYYGAREGMCRMHRSPLKEAKPAKIKLVPYGVSAQGMGDPCITTSCPNKTFSVTGKCGRCSKRNFKIRKIFKTTASGPTRRMNTLEEYEAEVRRIEGRCG